ncbi:class I SAM-dependent methyltransferase [Maritimibacter alexandrii]|uniref:class I SAM-dependent methyltransferase n=1 Tax=Maritimibacter alexandrii TaxID=2570355 RepID=UPI001108B9E7|nr:methyltransferase domain-containing protein [Maritimibacter alexandrii]
MEMTENLLLPREECPVCRSRDIKKIYEEPYTSDRVVSQIRKAFESGDPAPERLAEEAFVLAQCNACDMIFQTRVPSDAFAEEVYGRWINSKNLFRDKYARQSIKHFDTINRQVRACMSLTKKHARDIRFLDFGMGWGDHCAAAAGMGVKATGVELAAEKVEYAKNRGLEVIASTEGRQFDIIFSNQVFEHLSFPQDMIRLLAGSLAPGGAIVLATPNGAPLYKAAKKGPLSEGVVRENGKLCAPVDHINVFSQQTLNRLGATVGLKSTTFSPLREWRTKTLPVLKGEIVERLGLKQPSSVWAALLSD